MSLVPIKKLPSLDELYSDKAAFNENQDLMILLNQPPKKEWIETNPMTKLQYLPIGRVEYLLNMIFPTWSVEVLNTCLLANSIAVTVRVFVTFPNGVERHYDGVGAAPLQTDKDAGAIDFNRIKSAAVQMALPSAKSFAIKDAADHIGKLFGKDINRKNIEQNAFHIEETQLLQPQPEIHEDVTNLIAAISTIQDLNDAWNNNKDQWVTNKAIVQLVTARKAELIRPK